MKNNAPKRLGPITLIAAGLFLTFSSTALAQENGALQGTVVNAADKKVVTDVVVTATGPGGEQMGVTDAKGNYEIENLAPGTYTVRFEKEGFTPFARADINIKAGVKASFNVEMLPMEGFSEVVVVTGSRIPRVEVETAAPVSVVSRAKIESSGKASVGDILQQMPEQSGGINTQVNNGGDGSTRVDLRGLGSRRTLVLLNGRRVVAGGTGADSSVDLNTIPTQAISRIEVLKDGASAVYGSDAISGVVNIITREDFSGTEVQGFAGTSGRGDGTVYDFNFTTGQVTDRGNILFSAGYYNQSETWAGKRTFAYFDKDYDWTSRQIPTVGSSAIPMGRFAKAGTGAGNQTWSDLVAQYPTSSNFIVDPSSPLGFRPFKSTGVTEAGGDFYNYQPENFLVTPLQRANVFATGTLKITDNIKGYFEGTYTNRQSAQKLAPEPLFTAQEGVAVSGASVYNPFGRTLFDVRRRLVEFGNRDFAQDLNTFRLVTGVRGATPESAGPIAGLRWDLFFNYGRTQGVFTKEGLLQRSGVANALGPSFYDANGVARCGTPTNPIDNCVPLNLLGGTGTITKEMKEFLSYRGTGRGYNQQMIFGAAANKDLLKIGDAANPVAIAVGVEHRREEGAQIFDPLTNKGDTTGTKAADTMGGFRVNEAYAELSIPFLKRFGISDTPGDILELSAATRFVRYSSFGNNLSYKLGGRITPVQDITVRGTYSTAFRAPNIGELYSGLAEGFPAAQDPCSGDPDTNTPRPQGTTLDAACDADGVPDDLVSDETQLRARGGGNPNLQPETAKIFTMGVVLQPRFVKDLSFTVDYYNIDVRSAITSVGTDLILAGCYPKEDGVAPDAELCKRIHRDPNLNGKIDYIDDPLSNVGGDMTSGIDFGLNYEPSTPIGRIGLNSTLTLLQSFNRLFSGGKLVKGVGTYDLGAQPAWRATFGVNWNFSPVNAGVNLRYINGFKECEDNTCHKDKASAPDPISRQVANYYILDANVGYKLAREGQSTTTIMAGINNLLDVDPPFIANGFTANSDPTFYDFMGRYFYVRLSHSFN